ncbi:hypothetical protein GKC28_15200 [Leisingera sp. ANG59]|nr:hypothetical protein [Leisingera sp. ANG59]
MREQKATFAVRICGDRIVAPQGTAPNRSLNATPRRDFQTALLLQPVVTDQKRDETESWFGKFERVSLVDFLLPIRQRCRSEGAMMRRRPRRNHSPSFKAKVALAALKGDGTLFEPVTQLELHPNQSNHPCRCRTSSQRQHRCRSPEA